MSLLVIIFNKSFLDQSKVIRNEIILEHSMRRFCRNGYTVKLHSMRDKSICRHTLVIKFRCCEKDYWNNLHRIIRLIKHLADGRDLIRHYCSVVNHVLAMIHKENINIFPCFLACLNYLLRMDCNINKPVVTTFFRSIEILLSHCVAAIIYDYILHMRSVLVYLFDKTYDFLRRFYLEKVFLLAIVNSVASFKGQSFAENVNYNCFFGIQSTNACAFSGTCSTKYYTYACHFSLSYLYY